MHPSPATSPGPTDRGDGSSRSDRSGGCRLGSIPSGPTSRGHSPLRRGEDPTKFLCYNKFVKLFLSVAGGRTHIGTYVGVSPSPASNENNS